jgi:hypothetical protein
MALFCAAFLCSFHLAPAIAAPLAEVQGNRTNAKIGDNSGATSNTLGDFFRKRFDIYTAFADDVLKKVGTKFLLLIQQHCYCRSNSFYYLIFYSQIVGSPQQETSKLRTPVKKQLPAATGRLSPPAAAAGNPGAWRASPRLGSNSPHYPEPITQPIADVQKQSGFETALENVVPVVEGGFQS